MSTIEKCIKEVKDYQDKLKQAKAVVDALTFDLQNAELRLSKAMVEAHGKPNKSVDFEKEL